MPTLIGVAVVAVGLLSGAMGADAGVGVAGGGRGSD